MFYTSNVNDMRQYFYTSWAKHTRHMPLTALEQQIVDVILLHPEYHQHLEPTQTQSERHYFPELGETNPFLHMGLHLAVREQIQTDRPQGIASIYQQLLQHTSPMLAEHALMDCLAECLWQAQRNNTPPDETHFLTLCNELMLAEKSTL